MSYENIVCFKMLAFLKATFVLYRQNWICVNYLNNLHSFFNRTNKYKFRLTVLNFFENLRLYCSLFVLKLIGRKN